MTAVAAPSAPLSAAQRSPWHSPVPYLFGGLAAMLGLIAFALLILACSYWKLSGYLENNEDERDMETGTDVDGDFKVDAKAAPVYEEKFLVIMAGQSVIVWQHEWQKRLASPHCSLFLLSLADNHPYPQLHILQAKMK